MSNIRRYLANRLAALRASKDWSQHDLAAACIDPASREPRSASWVRGYEQQTRWPDPEDLDLLARALGVSPESLLTPPIEPSVKDALAVIERELAMRPPPDPLAERVARIAEHAPDLAESILEQIAEGERTLSSAQGHKGTREKDR